MVIGVLGWSLQRPWALAGLLLAVLVVLLSLQRRRALAVPLGTARLFAPSGSPTASERRRWLSASRAAAIAAILAGTLALAAPHRPQEGPRGDVLVALVDRTPSMFLPLDGRHEGGPRRVDAAVAACREWALGRERDRGVPVRIVWADVHAADPFGTATGSADEWLTAPPVLPSEALWGVHDREGVAWITDRMPAEQPARAGVFASGGPGVPGLVAVDADGGWRSTADGDAPLVRDPDAAIPLVLIGPGVPDELATLARIWAQHRGLGAADSPGGRSAETDAACVLRLDGPGTANGDASGAVERLEVGRDGWFATVRTPGTLDTEPAGPEPEGPAERVWLTDAPPPGRALHPLVTVGPGRVRVAFTNIEVATGAAAEFAVSWSALFDAARRLPPGVVSLEERAGAGAAARVEPTPLDVASGSALLAATGGPGAGALAGVAAKLAEQDAARRARRLAGALAAAAAALGLASAALRLRGSA